MCMLLNVYFVEAHHRNCVQFRGFSQNISNSNSWISTESISRPVGNASLHIRQPTFGYIYNMQLECIKHFYEDDVVL